jgi:DNA-binding CsgD family transcriptional regulator
MDAALASAGSVIAPTKLHVPASEGAPVARDAELLDRLHAARAARLALVAAPPGPRRDGLLARWLEGDRRPVAWLTLDPEDADPVRLWRGVIAALRTLQPSFGSDAEAILAAGPAALPDAVVALVVAEAAAADPPPVLVLDGAEALGEHAGDVVASLLAWVAHAPAELLLVVAGEGALLGALAAAPGAVAIALDEDGAPRAQPPARTPGTPAAAIDAALAGGRAAEAAALIARAWPAALRRGEHATVQRWIGALPPSAAAGDPDLWLVRLWAALDRGALATAERQIATAGPAIPPAARTRGHLLHATDALRRGDLDGTARRIDAAAQGDPQDGFWHTTEALLRGHESFWRGHPRVAYRHFARAGGLAAVHGDRFAMTAAIGFLALLACEGGDDEAARRRLGRLEDLRDADPAVGEHPVAVAGALAEGRMLELAGAYESAVAPLRRAIALAERGASCFERAEPRLRLATAHRMCHRPEAAAVLEAEALAILGACADHGRLAGIAAAVAPAAPRRDVLSPSERAVLRMLPSGLSQREIGAELFLSVNTVKTHCRNIYAKLHAGSRDEAVARAHDLGLL